MDVIPKFIKIIYINLDKIIMYIKLKRIKKNLKLSLCMYKEIKNIVMPFKNFKSDVAMFADECAHFAPNNTSYEFKSFL